MTWVRVLLAGQLSPTKAALSGGLVSDGVITCPGHFRRFDLRTGRCVGRPWEQVRSYECAVADGWVQ
ncbi:MAG TPA: nitrite reductase (NAD(P)H) small subunit, partial [Streptosporangiaceae bacterium]